jgi:hypothetical protein
MAGLSQIGAIVTSLGLSTGPYVDASICGSVAGAYSLTGGCGILLLTKLGGYLFDNWTPGAPFYIMAMLNIVALISAIAVILIDRSRPKIQLSDRIDEEPLIDENDA